MNTPPPDIRASAASAPATIIVGTAGIGRPSCWSRTFSPTSGTPWRARSAISDSMSDQPSRRLGRVETWYRRPGFFKGALAGAVRTSGEVRMDPRIQNAASVPSTAQPDIPAATWPRSPRSLAAGRGAAWWSEGWRVFMAAPLLWVGMIVAVAVLFFVLAIVPIIGQIVLMLIGPVIFGGLLLGCHALAKGKPLTFAHLFAGFNEGRALPLGILGVLYFV